MQLIFSFEELFRFFFDKELFRYLFSQKEINAVVFFFEG